MDRNTTINRVLANFFENILKEKRYYLEVGKVLSVDESSLSFVFESSTGNPESEVYMSVFESENYIVPEVGSVVLVGYTDKTNKYCLSVQNAEKIIMRGGSLGGLINIEDLTTKLNGLKSDVSKIYQALSNWTPVSGDGGAALKAFYSALLPTAPNDFNKSDYEDENVKH